MFGLERIVNATVGDDGNIRQSLLDSGEIFQARDLRHAIGRTIAPQTFLPSGAEQKGVNPAFGKQGDLFDTLFNGKAALGVFGAGHAEYDGKIRAGTFLDGADDHVDIAYAVFRAAAEFVRPAVAPGGKELTHVLACTAVQGDALKAGLINAASGFGIAPEVLHHLLTADFARALHVP